MKNKYSEANRKNEAPMKSKKVLKTICLVLMGLFGVLGFGSLAHAEDRITIGENSDDGPSSFMVTQEVKYATLNIAGGDFTYEIMETDGLDAVEGVPNIDFTLEPMEQTSTAKNLIVDFSDVSVPATPAVYNMKLSISSAPEDLAYNDEIAYTFDVVVQNAFDEEYQPTGGYFAFITNLRKVVSGMPQFTKVDHAHFLCYNDFVPKKYSYIEITNTVEGNDSSKDDVFKYELLIEGSEEDRYTIDAPSKKYTFGGKSVQSDTEAIPGEIATLYLKHGESAIIGKSETDENEILVGLSYSYTEYADVEGYTTWIDDKSLGERVKVEKIAYENPTENKTLFINRRAKETIIDKIVNTGLELGNGAFMILGAASIVCVVILLLVRSKEKT